MLPVFYVMKYHQPLFSIPFLSSHWEKEFQTFQNSSQAVSLVAHLNIWNERDKLNEASTDVSFVPQFFREIWGYALQGDSKTGYQCYSQNPVKRAGQTGGMGKADLALGWFGEADMPGTPPQVLCEFKDIRSNLDKEQNRGGNKRSPVKQCLAYLREALDELGGHELVKPAWGIVTDTNEFRLYHHKKGEQQYQRFVISPSSGDEAESLLANNDSAAFQRFLFYKMFHRDTLLSRRGPSPLEELLSDHIIHEAELERDFYLEYKAYREYLFKTLVEANPDFSGTKGKLVRLTQRFLDRCLFVLFCEDMGQALDFPTNLLRKILSSVSCDEYYNPEDPTPWDRVKNIFRIMRDGGLLGRDQVNRFNGGLFATLPELENLIIPAKVFCAHNQAIDGSQSLLKYPLTLLYFSAKYNFGIKNAEHRPMIDLYALGRIFEQSITELEIMEAEAEGRPSLNLLSQRKRDGVYYTPERITAYVVEETIGARLRDIKEKIGLTEDKRPDDALVTKHRSKGKGKKPKEVDNWLNALTTYRQRLRELKIIDPACGSGAFLIQAMEQLKREYRWVTEETKRIKRSSTFGDWDVIVKDILANNLYGVDLNAESVEITKLALWMHTASPGKPLSSLDAHVQCGNSLVGADFYQYRKQDDFSEGEQERINAFDWAKTFPQVFAQGGFDCVIGNPPYVKLQNFRKVQSAVAEYLLQARLADGEPLYASAQTGNFDLYLLFIEKGVKLLKPDGRMGYIAPNVWMMNEYGQGLRAFIKKGRCLDRWVDFKSFQVFQEAITYTALQFFRGKPLAEVRCAFAPDGDLAAIDWKAPQATVPYEELSDTEAWNLMPDSERKLIARLNASGKTLEQCCAGIFVGIQTSADSVYHLTLINPGRYRTKDGNEVDIEDTIMHSLVSGSEARRYQAPATETYLLFPYDISGEKPRLFSSDEMDSRFPLAFAYLKQHGQTLRSREHGKFDDDFWYRFGRHQNIGIQEQPKLLVPRLISRLFCAMDEGGRVYLDNVDVGGILVSNQKDLPYLAGILNAPVCNFIWRRTSKPFQNDYRSANKQFIAPLTIPDATKPEKAEVARLANELQRLHTQRRDQIAKFGKRWQSGQTTDATQKESWLWAEIGRAEHHAALEALLRPGARFTVEHPGDELRLRINGTTAIELFDKPETPYVAAQWRHILRNVTVTESFNAKKLVRLLLHLRKSDQQELKDHLVKLDEEIAQTEAAITKTEAEMNALVYRLYKLTEEEIKIVEGEPMNEKTKETT